MKKGRNLIKKIHLWLGLCSGLVVFMVCLTGSILTFEEELDSTFSPKFYEVDAMGAKTLSMDVLQETVLQQFPDAVVQRIDIFAKANRTVQFQLNNKAEDLVYLVSINPYTGQIQGAAPIKKRFFEIVLQMHRFLLLGKVGKAITGVSCIIFVLLLGSGLYLWWPKKCKHLKKRLVIKWKSPWARRLWDMHSVLGFYALTILLTIALSGLVWSYKWYDNLVHYLANGGSKPNMEVLGKGSEFLDDTSTSSPFSLQKITNQAAILFPFEGDTRILFPAKAQGVYKVRKMPTVNSVPNKRSTLFFDGTSGSVLNVVPYEKLTNGEKVRRMLFPIHTGAIGGWPTKLLALLACLVGASLPITGVLFWLKQQK